MPLEDMKKAMAQEAIRRQMAAESARRAQAGAQQPAGAENTPTGSPAPAAAKPNGTLAGAFAHGATFGFADELRAGIRAGLGMGEGGSFGERYDNELKDARAMIAQANEDHPVLAPVAEIGGAIAPMVLTGGSAGLVNGGRLAASAGGRIALGAAEGAGTGALYGFGTGEGGLQNRADNAMWQGGLGAVAGGSVAGVMNKLAARSARSMIPTTAEIGAAKTAAYRDAVDGSGVILRPDATNRLSSQIQQNLLDIGYSPNLHPKVAPLLREIRDASGQNITPRQLQNYMAAARDIAADTLPNGAPSQQGVMGRRIVDDIRAYMENTPASDVLTGNVGMMNRGFREGSELNSRFRRSQQVGR